MSITKHTPGPWKWGYEDKSVLALYGPNGAEDHVLWCQICPSCQKHGGLCTAPSEADATLIAAAPDLLAELKDLVHFISMEKSSPVGLSAAYAAIAKARGQA